MGYKKSEISIQHIIRAATRVLARQGYANTSLLDIANEAGMSKGSIHYHFPTKEALIRDVLKSACDTVQARTMDALALEGDPQSALRKAIETLWDVRSSKSDEVMVIADLMAQSLSEPGLRAELSTYYRLGASQIQEYIVTLEAFGLKPTVPASHIPRLLIALLDGLVLQSLVDDEALGAEDIISAVEKIAIAFFGIALPPTTKTELQPTSP